MEVCRYCTTLKFIRGNCSDTPFSMLITRSLAHFPHSCGTGKKPCYFSFGEESLD